MNPNGNPAGAGRSARHVIHSAMLAVLAMSVLLLGLFGAHSAVAEPEAGGTLAAASAQVEEVAGEDGSSVAALAAVAVAAQATAAQAVAAQATAAGDRFLAACALIALICSVLFVLVSHVLLARRPSVSDRLLGARGFVVDSFWTIAPHLHRPSLTSLSISRV